MLFANVAAGVISVNPAGQITTWNMAAERMLGLSAAGALGRNYEEVFESESLHVMREIVESVKDRGSVEREIKIPLSEQHLTAMVSAASLGDDGGRTVGVMGLLEGLARSQK